MKRKIIDSHMHIVQLERDGVKALFENLNEYQENNGITALDDMCCTNNGDLWNGYEADQSILGAIAKIENSSIFTHGCLFIPKEDGYLKRFDFKDQLEELMEVGVDGIKICDFKPDAYKLFNVGAHIEEYDEFIGYCEKYGVHMCWHVADPETSWDADKVTEMARQKGWFYGDGTYPTYDDLINMTYAFLDSHPRLNVLLAHMFFKSFEPREVVEILEKYPNVCFDMAPGWEMFAGFKTHYAEWSDIFRRYSTRFLYATDMTLPRDIEFLNTSAQLVLKFLETDAEFEVRAGHFTKGIKLDGEHLDNILYRNHENIVGKTPNGINKRALRKYIEKYLPLFPNSKNKMLIEEYYRKNLI